MINGLLAVATPLVGAFASLDGATILLLATLAGVVGGQAKIVAAVGLAGSALRGLGNLVIKPLVVDYTGLGLAATGAATGIDKATAAAARGRGGRGLIGGLTVGLVAATVGWEVARRAMDSYNEKLEEVIATTKEIGPETAEAVNESLSWWEQQGRDFANVFNLKNFQFWKSRDTRDEEIVAENLREAADAADKAAEAQGAYAEASKEVTDTQGDLNKLLATGGASAEELAEAVNTAGAAQADKNRIDAEAKGLMEAYAAATYGAVDATLALIDKEYAAESARNSFKDQIKETNKILDDQKSSRREQAEAIDDVAQSALTAAAAQVELAKQEALLQGTTLSAADAHDVLIDSLEKSLKVKGLDPAAKKEIQDIIDRLKEAQTTADEGIVIGGIRWKEGTTETQIKGLQDSIKAAMTVDPRLAQGVQEQLNALKWAPVNQVVNIVGSDGKPLGDVSVKVNTTVGNLPNTQNVLDGLEGDREVKFNTVVRNVQNTENVLTGLAGDREVKYNTVVRNVQNTENVLGGLDNPRDVYIEVHLTGVEAARRTLGELDNSRSLRGVSSVGPTAIAAAPVVYNQSFSIDVSGAGNPATTAREIERYIRRAGDRSKVSVN